MRNSIVAVGTAVVLACASVVGAADGPWQWDISEKASGGDAHFRLWIPPRLDYARGVFLFSKYGSFDGYAADKALRSLAEELQCAVILTDQHEGSPYPDTAKTLACLSRLAAQSGHVEIGNAPLFIFGHSNSTHTMGRFGAGAADRVIAWVAMKSAFGEQFSVPALYDVPGMVICGEKDDSYFQDQLATVKRLRREKGALMHIIIEAEGPHWPVGETNEIMQAFVKTVFYLRVPRDADARLGPVKLAKISESSGWLGKNLDGVRVRTPDFKWRWESPVDVRQHLPIASYDDYVGDKATASWMPDESYARKWQEFCRTAAIKDWATLPAGFVDRWRRGELAARARVVESEVLPRIADRLSEAKTYGPIIKELERLVSNASDAAKSQEAERIIAELEKRAAEQIAQAKRLEEMHPAMALNAYAQVAKRFAGTDSAEAARARARDSSLMQEAKACRYLDAMRSASSEMKNVSGAQRTFEDTRFRSANASQFDAMIAAARVVLRRYSRTRAAATAKELLASYGVRTAK